jgi:Uma2 family endonuclease
MRNVMLRSRRHYTLDDYFMVELGSPTKHEFYNGEIFAMAGASIAHNDITSNVLAILRSALRGKGCRAFASDLRVATPGNLYTYPDVSVICGKVATVPGRPDTATNPILLVEVLSEATCDYDRGEKFELYKEIGGFKEYVLIDQGAVLVEHWRRTRSGTWTVKKHARLAEILRLHAVPVALPLTEIYREVFV